MTTNQAQAASLFVALLTGDIDDAPLYDVEHDLTRMRRLEARLATATTTTPSVACAIDHLAGLLQIAIARFEQRLDDAADAQWMSRDGIRRDRY